MVKRGDDIPGYGLSGPHGTNLYNFAEKQAVQLDARNAWAHCTNELYPSAPPMLRIPRITWFIFQRVGRDWVLVRDDEHGMWVLFGLTYWRALEAQKRKKAEEEERLGRERDEGEDGGATGGGPDGPSDGDGSDNQDGGTENAIEEDPESAADPKSPPDEDEYPIISAAPRRVRSRRDLQSGRAAILCIVRNLARRAPFFRHTLWLASVNAPRLKAPVRRFAARAQNALRVAAHRFNVLLGDAGQIVQDDWFGALFEPQVVERAGLRLTVLTFSAYPRPAWESWLFGKLIEDELAAYEVSQGT